jgi:choline kinase
LSALILAAGRGSRMGSLTEARPKCLVSLGGRTLLEWQTTALRQAGIPRIAIVTGWQPEQLAPHAAVTFHNPRWAQTQMVMSLARAAPWLESGSCVVSYSDIFYTAPTVKALLEAEGDIAITYDPDWLSLWSRRFSDPLSDAETFELDAAGRLVDIGRKSDDAARIQGQYMGLLKFRPAGWAQVARLLASLAPDERDRLDMTGLLRRLLAAGSQVSVVRVAGPWGEVDTASDLALYEDDLRRGRLVLEAAG